MFRVTMVQMASNIFFSFFKCFKQYENQSTWQTLIIFFYKWYVSIAEFAGFEDFYIDTLLNVNTSHYTIAEIHSLLWTNATPELLAACTWKSKSRRRGMYSSSETQQSHKKSIWLFYNHASYSLKCLLDITYLLFNSYIFWFLYN